jgi:hypothetical protein
MSDKAIQALVNLDKSIGSLALNREQHAILQMQVQTLRAAIQAEEKG